MSHERRGTFCGLIYRDLLFFMSIFIDNDHLEIFTRGGHLPILVFLPHSNVLFRRTRDPHIDATKLDPFDPMPVVNKFGGETPLVTQTALNHPLLDRICASVD